MTLPCFHVQQEDGSFLSTENGNGRKKAKYPNGNIRKNIDFPFRRWQSDHVMASLLRSTKFRLAGNPSGVTIPLYPIPLALRY